MFLHLKTTLLSHAVNIQSLLAINHLDFNLLHFYVLEWNRIAIWLLFILTNWSTTQLSSPLWTPYIWLQPFRFGIWAKAICQSRKKVGAGWKFGCMTESVGSHPALQSGLKYLKLTALDVWAQSWLYVCVFPNIPGLGFSFLADGRKRWFNFSLLRLPLDLWFTTLDTLR